MEKKYKRAIKVGDIFDIVECKAATVVDIATHKGVHNDYAYTDNSPDTKIVVYKYRGCNGRTRYEAMPLGSFLFSAVLKWEAEHIEPFTKEDRISFFEKNGIVYK